MKLFRTSATALCAIAFLIALSHRTLAAPADPSFNDAQTKAIESIIHNYLVSHPSVLLEAQQALQEQRKKAQAAKRKKIFAHLPSFVDQPGVPMLGNPKAKTTIVQFFDYACAFCRRDWPVLKKLVETNHNIRVALVEFPIIKQESYTAALLSISVWQHAPKAFMTYHDALLSLDGEDLPDETVKAAAKAAGLTDAQVTAGATSQDLAQEVAGNNNLADQIGIRGTPAFIIYANKHPGAAKFFPQYLDETELAAAIADVQKSK